MKKLILGVFSVLLMCSSVVYANQGMTAEDKVQKLKTDLNLSVEQESQVRPIIQEYKTKLDALIQEKENKLTGVLSSEQLSKMRALKNNRSNNY